MLIDSKSSVPVMTDTTKIKFFVEGGKNKLIIKHLPENTTWLTDTTYHHTAFNASMHPRVHIVGVMLDGIQRRN